MNCLKSLVDILQTGSPSSNWIPLSFGRSVKHGLPLRKNGSRKGGLRESILKAYLLIKFMFTV